MKSKTIIFLGAVVIILSTAFAFNTNSNQNAATENVKSTSSNNSGGFVLEDTDQWK
ncbi:MAG: hypothetical protein JNM78_08335 [Cyclobacteriaceae bacterium]|nr:hypothetical protein [Cyclobacteriaceae bacterium]